MGVLLIPILITLTLFLVHQFQLSYGSSYFAVLVSVLLFMWLFEKLLPAKPVKVSPKHYVTDLLFLALNPLFLPLLWYFLMKKLLPVEFDPFGFPSSLPLISQVLLFFLASEFFRYWAHRFQHEFPRLWAFHAVHHCMPQMYYLNQFISHPVDYFLRNVLTLTPLMLLKFDPWAIAYSQGISTLMAMLSHANIKVQHRRWNSVFPTYEVHRWHHSIVPSEANANYGVGVLVWDHVFGTYKKAPETAVEIMGIDDKSYVISDWAGLLKRPFFKKS